ncbi:MAG: chromosomal replication initiator protein DnaA [Christensenellales bacterium]
MQELQIMWERVLSKLEMMTTAVSFDLWIRPLEVLEFKDYNTLILVASSTTAKNQLLKNHKIQLQNAINEVFNDNINFEILDQNEKDEYIKTNTPAKNQKVEEEGNKVCSNFNEKYNFDNFVVGKSNQFVYAAAKAVAENPGQKFNPLFIYGGVGLGKTHLLHAIGNYIKSAYPDKKIMYATCEKFTNDYIESLRANKDMANFEFREKYRNLDVLMIDDIQFISNKTSTQEEFFHTFNDLYQRQKQIIIASDRPPKEIATLEERLRSRFTSGLIQDIQTPDFETRVAILRKKAQQEKYSIDDEVINFIAEKIDTNIREMEGVLSKVFFFATLLGKKSATLDEAYEAMKENMDEIKEGLSPDLVIDTVCKYFNISKSDIIGKKKNKEIVEPRMICIYLICELLDLPLVAIGKKFGDRDHTTIMHARDKISEQIKTNNKIKVYITDIKDLLTK